MMGRAKTKRTAVPLKTKLKKDPGVPRLPNLKVKVRSAQSKPMVPEERRTDPDTPMASEPTLTTLAQLPEASTSSQPQNSITDDPSSVFDPSSFEQYTSTSASKPKEQMRKYYLKALHKVVDESDIIILVLDARDPEGCRSRLVEEEVRRREGEGKRLVFVLNKIDLIPKSNAQQWLKHLRHSTPTLPFLAPPSTTSSSSARTHISSSTAPSLLKLLKAYKPKAGSVTIGVVGYPNVGKSSLINCLKRSKVCPVASTPGHTRALQSITLERGMRIIDSPGVVFDEDDFDDGKGSQERKGSILLRNVVRAEDVQDPVEVVSLILERTPQETIQKIYNIPEFAGTQEFLTMVALSGGRLLKGGTPDLIGAARQVLGDWNQQKIPYFSVPPAVHPSLVPSTVAATRTDSTPTIAPGAENVGQAQILSQFSQPFTLEGLFGAADAGAFGGDSAGGDVNMGVDVDGEEDVFYDAMDEDGIAMESDDLKHIIPRKRSRSPSSSDAPEADLSTASIATLTQPSSTLPHTQPPSTAAAAAAPDRATWESREPKRQRRNKDVPAYDAPPERNVLAQMGRSNPLGRRNLKREAKRARKAERGGNGGGNGAGGMEVDDEGLQFTFIA